MSNQIIAQQVVDRIKTQCGGAWLDSPADVFIAGNSNSVVTGITTSFTPSIEVLKKSVAANKNLIITQQPAYYGQTEPYLQSDQAFLFKKDFIEKNNLVIWRFYENWNSRKTDGQLLGLVKALGWDKYHLTDSGEEPYAKANKYFMLPEGTLADKVLEIEKKLHIPGIRVIGDPDTKIKKAALSHGMFQLSELQEFLKEPDVDLIIIAEAIEWEACEYFRDILTWKGKNKAMILIGREASEDPGYGEVASWLKTFIPEVSIKWIPANEPFWIA
ncbi:MAG: Nif3-like dinuclear metal center hexameric protein [Bacteroidota bacterium]|nr:Nif3-like dinuclear metal center hexameric protein [Bacteroidota bacterium]